MVVINNVENERLNVQTNLRRVELFEMVNLFSEKRRNRQKSLVPFTSYWSNFGADDFLLKLNYSKFSNNFFRIIKKRNNCLGLLFHEIFVAVKRKKYGIDTVYLNKEL